MTLLNFTVDRDSVCAGDDADPHQTMLTLPATATLQQLIAAARSVCPLASIAGGHATWLVEIGRPARCVAVIAQQWDEPRLLVADGIASEFGANGPCSLYFRYGAQRDPQAVFDALRAGAPLPPR
jgi:hypothetical protein